ncbi:hypothetical protein BpHYR1_015216 [Brachionus plicatilis]|uniref:Uncharacterized protein n=1 Tax=Brachionus plicatilis TaxID=10195 RepID=A0A3M7R7W7_BRAPC|nr:hypothetical protein BpHYR1_015216 [Brachionus plicatilis]
MLIKLSSRHLKFIWYILPALKKRCCFKLFLENVHKRENTKVQFNKRIKLFTYSCQSLKQFGITSDVYKKIAQNLVLNQQFVFNQKKIRRC